MRAGPCVYRVWERVTLGRRQSLEHLPVRDAWAELTAPSASLRRPDRALALGWVRMADGRLGGGHVWLTPLLLGTLGRPVLGSSSGLLGRGFYHGRSCPHVCMSVMFWGRSFQELGVQEAEGLAPGKSVGASAPLRAGDKPWATGLASAGRHSLTDPRTLSRHPCQHPRGGGGSHCPCVPGEPRPVGGPPRPTGPVRAAPHHAATEDTKDESICSGVSAKHPLAPAAGSCAGPRARVTGARGSPSCQAACGWHSDRGASGGAGGRPGPRETGRRAGASGKEGGRHQCAPCNPQPSPSCWETPEGLSTATHQ